MITVLILIFLTLISYTPATAVELGERRLYECIPIQQRPILDGRLDDSCWKTASVTGEFTRTIQDVDKLPSHQTYVRLLYDDQYLYVGIKCEEPHPEKLCTNILEDDNVSICGDDCIEMFFQPNPESTDYYQLVVNSRGVRYDGFHLDGTWNADWQARTFIDKEAWYIEVAIALSSFPERQNVWRFNVCRELRSTEPIELHCWSNTYGGFHNPDRFGHLIFSGPFASLQRGYLIQAANYARSTLAIQQQLKDQTQAIREMRLQAPAQAAHFDDQLNFLKATEKAILLKYGSKQELSLEEWRVFDDSLGNLLKTSEEVYWALRFYLILND